MRDVFQIEVTAFVSPKAIPALVPNVRGCERGPACGVDEINVVSRPATVLAARTCA